MRKDYSNVETILSMILLLLLSVCIFTLLTTGNNTEKRIIEQNNIKSNARTAVNYINLNLKANDVSNAINVKQNPNSGDNAIVITTNINGEKTNKWIYFTNNYLMESITPINSPPNDENATKIAKIDDFSVVEDDKKIITNISYIYNNEPNTIQQVFVLRSK